MQQDYPTAEQVRLCIQYKEQIIDVFETKRVDQRISIRGPVAEIGRLVKEERAANRLTLHQYRQLRTYACFAPAYCNCNHIRDLASKHREHSLGENLRRFTRENGDQDNPGWPDSEAEIEPQRRPTAGAGPGLTKRRKTCGYG